MIEVWMDSEGDLYEIDYDECFELRELDPNDLQEPWECLGEL